MCNCINFLNVQSGREGRRAADEQLRKRRFRQNSSPLDECLGHFVSSYLDIGNTKRECISGGPRITVYNKIKYEFVDSTRERKIGNK